MQVLIKKVISFLFLFFFVLTEVAAQAKIKQQEGWISLLDSSLSQWETYLSYRHKPGYNGSVPVDEKGDTLQPVGYNKNVNNVFSVMNENRELALKVTGEVYGCVFTKQAFDNYHLKLKVKWGFKKWPPRTAMLRDAGIIYHSQGPCGADYWRAWMLGQELQIMEGHMGDYWSIANSAIDIKAFLPEGTMNAAAGEKQPFLPVGAGTGNTGYCVRSADYESDFGQYTTIELICFNGKSLHIVNGKVVMVLANSRYWDGSVYKPLSQGKIQLQSEAAEVYYKDIQIKELDSLSEKYASYFK